MREDERSGEGLGHLSPPCPNPTTHVEKVSDTVNLHC